MKYFKYQSGSMSKVWSLFRGLGDMTPEQIDKMYGGSDYSHTLEIVNAALNGSISLTDEAVNDFNLPAYEYRCRENEKNGNFKRAKEILNIVEFDGSDEEEKIGYGDISSRKLQNNFEESFDEIMSSETFESNIKQLFDIRSKYIIEHSIDPVSALINSLKGIPEAIQEVKQLMCDAVIKDLIVSLCEDSRDGKLLRVLEATA